MARYDFKCDDCDNLVELEMRISEYHKDGHLCEVCGKEMKQIICAPNVVVPIQHRAAKSFKQYYGRDINTGKKVK